MLKFYLKTLRPLAEILKSEEGRIGIVLCNESGDLDSVVCSTVLAAFLQKTLGFSHLLSAALAELALHFDTFV